MSSPFAIKPRKRPEKQSEIDPDEWRVNKICCFLTYWSQRKPQGSNSNRTLWIPFFRVMVLASCSIFAATGFHVVLAFRLIWPLWEIHCGTWTWLCMKLAVGYLRRSNDIGRRKLAHRALVYIESLLKFVIHKWIKKTQLISKRGNEHNLKITFYASSWLIIWYCHGQFIFWLTSLNLLIRSYNCL